MARKRMIDPEFWLDEKLATVSPHARLLFIGLWGICDDNYATLPNRPAWIKAQIFPYENVDTPRLLDELSMTGGLVLFKDENGEEYWFIKNFFKYQKIDKPSKPKYAQFDEHSTSTPAEVKLSKDKLSKDKKSEAKLKEESVREKPIIPPASPSGSPFTKEEQEILNTPEDKKFSSKCERLEEIEKLQYFKSGLKAKGLMFLMFFLLVLPVHATTVSINYQISLSPAKAYKLVLKEPSISPPKQALKTTGSGGSKTFEGYTLEEIVNRVAVLESGDGKEVGLHGYCLRQGGTNKYGYLPTPTFCFKTEEEAKLTISKWFAKRLDKRPLYDCLCEYNLGKKGLVNCMYYQHFISI
jgi:hypothetical protein